MSVYLSVARRTRVSFCGCCPDDQIYPRTTFWVGTGQQLPLAAVVGAQEVLLSDLDGQIAEGKISICPK